MITLFDGTALLNTSERGLTRSSSVRSACRSPVTVLKSVFWMRDSGLQPVRSRMDGPSARPTCEIASSSVRDD